MRIINNNKLNPDWDGYDEIPPTTEKDKLFAKELFNLIQELIDGEKLNEEFTSERSLLQHFHNHCIADNPERNSTRSNIYYDFTNVDKYRLYENEINRKVIDTPMLIGSLDDTELITNYFHKLFEGGKSIRFTYSCGFQNAHGNVTIGINAFSNNNTTNYENGNTVDLIIIGRNNQTVTMYPVDANYLQNKLNNIIDTYTDFETRLNYNR